MAARSRTIARFARVEPAESPRCKVPYESTRGIERGYLGGTDFSLLRFAPSGNRMTRGAGEDSLSRDFIPRRDLGVYELSAPGTSFARTARPESRDHELVPLNKFIVIWLPLSRFTGEFPLLGLDTR